MLPRNIGTIPPDLLAAGAVGYYDFVRFDFAPVLRLTNWPGGLTADVDGLGSATWEDGTLLPVASSSQGAKNPITVDEVQCANKDGFWTDFVTAAANGVYDFDVSIFRGYYDNTGAYVGSWEMFVGYTDAISALYTARIALKSQTNAHGVLCPPDRFTNADFPTEPSADDVLVIGNTTSKQPSVSAQGVFYDQTPNDKAFTGVKSFIDLANSGVPHQPYTPDPNYFIPFEDSSPATPVDPGQISKGPGETRT